MAWPLYNAFAQTNVSGTDGTTNFSLTDWLQLDTVAGSTAYVDSSLTAENGKINSTMAFRDISTALGLSPPGTTIICRPGTYSFDGLTVIQRAGIRLIGYGAIIAPITAGFVAGFAVAGNFCTIEGFEFDGGVAAPDAVDVDDGVIHVFGASNTTLRNLNIHDHNFHGVHLLDRFPGVMIDSCRIANCNNGINSPGSLTQSVQGVTIKNCNIGTNRNHGIELLAVNNAGSVSLSDVRIMNNDVASNDSASSGSSGIDIGAAVTTCQITGNKVYSQFNGITIVKGKDVSVTDNTISSITNESISFNGWDTIKISGNRIDGRNPNTGDPATLIGIHLSGDYSAANDSTQAQISDNLIQGIATSGNGATLRISHGNNISICANTINAPADIELTANSIVSMMGNAITMTGTTVPIIIDASDRGWTQHRIIGNMIYQAGTTGRLIATTDASGTGIQDGLRIIANHSRTGATYSTGIVSNIAGAVPTNVFYKANSPETGVVVGGAWDNRSGWINNEMLVSKTLQLQIARGTASELVIGPRKPGWSVPGGTLDRGAFSTYAAPTISNPPTQAEVQAIADSYQEASQRLAALINDLHASGSGSPTHALLTIT